MYFPAVFGCFLLCFEHSLIPHTPPLAPSQMNFRRYCGVLSDKTTRGASMRIFTGAALSRPHVHVYVLCRICQCICMPCVVFVCLWLGGQEKIIQWKGTAFVCLSICIKGVKLCFDSGSWHRTRGVKSGHLSWSLSRSSSFSILC